MRRKPSAGRHAEARAVDAQHAGRAQQREHVVLVGPPGRQRDLRHRVERRPPARRTRCRESRSGASAVIVGALLAAPRGTRPDATDRRVSAAVTAYCIGTVLHRRPSASFAIAATTSSSRGERPTAHPAGAPAGREVRLRQAREGDDRRVGIEAADRRDRAVVAEIAVDLVGENRRGRAGRRCRAARAASPSNTTRRSDCSDR